MGTTMPVVLVEFLINLVRIASLAACGSGLSAGRGVAKSYRLDAVCAWERSSAISITADVVIQPSASSG